MSAERELRVAYEPPAGGASGAPATEGQPAREADQLREDIKHDREQLGDTAEALAGKADVKARVTERVEQRKQQLRDLGQQAQTKLGDQQQIKQLAGTVQQKARGNLPMVVGAGVLAVTALFVVRRRRR